MRRGLLIAGRLILAGIFLYAGYAKLREPWLQFAVSIETFKIVPEAMLEPMARIVPWVEVVAGLGLLVSFTARWAALLTTLMLGAFVGAGAWAYAKGTDVDCGCFGSGQREGLGFKWFAEDGAMLLLALAVTVGAFMMARQRRASRIADIA
jgi:uncharacterized membrane protein YphA (DoxX/SURF4 family)